MTTIVFTQRPLGITVPRAMPIVVSRITPAGHAMGARPRMILRSFNGQDASKANSYDSFLAGVSLLPEFQIAPIQFPVDRAERGLRIAPGTAPVDASVVISSALADPSAKPPTPISEDPEKRIDPEERKIRSFADLDDACKNTYSMAEIEAHWNAMKLYK